MNTADGNVPVTTGGGTDFIQLAALAVSAYSAYSTNRAARKEAASNRAFQSEMSSSSHQREVADLRAAGLNPILSGTGGAGASTPSGAVAPVQDIGNTALSQASMLRLQRRQATLLQEQATKERTQGILNNQLENESRSRQAVNVWDAATRFNQAATAQSEARMAAIDAEVAEAAKKGRLDQAKVDSSPEKAKARWIDMYSSTAGGAAQAAAKAASAVRGGAGVVARGAKNLWGGHGSARAFGTSPMIRRYIRQEPVLPRRLR